MSNINYRLMALSTFTKEPRKEVKLPFKVSYSMPRFKVFCPDMQTKRYDGRRH